ERLGTDHIDLYQCHRFDADAPLDETLRALDDLVSAGKVLYIGVSEWTAGQLDEARAVGDRLLLDPIVSNQPQYSLLWRRIEEDVIPVSERLGVGQIVWSPLAQGVLSGKYRPGEPTPRDTRAGHPDPQTSQFVRLFMREDILEAVQRLRPIADDLGLTMAQLAIAWVLRQPNVAGAIVGASRPEQLADQLGDGHPLLAHRIDERRLDAVARGQEAVLHEHLRRRLALVGHAVAQLEGHQALHERGQRCRGLQRDLRVHDAHLDRPEAGLRADVPPQKRRLRERLEAQQQVDRAHVIGVAVERARDADAGEGLEERRARRGQPAVAPLPERRVGRQGEQHRQVRAQPVDRADRVLGLGHAHVDVQRERRLAPRELAHRAVDDLVALAARD